MIRITGKTPLERYREFRAQIEPELEKERETPKSWNDVAVGEWARKESDQKRIRREKTK